MYERRTYEFRGGILMIFTFWEGNTMPAYLQLCRRTWLFPYISLTYETVNDYTDLVIDEKLKRFTFPQIADCVRVHVLRDNGGYWLDADTIMLTDKLPEENMVGDYNTKMNTIGFLHTEEHSQMYEWWAIFQDSVIKRQDTPKQWNVMGNAFTDKYLKEHPEITIKNVADYWPETYMIDSNISRYEKYRKFYFEEDYHLKDIHDTTMLMLHNSWTPDWYKALSEKEVLQQSCTMSNILREVLQ